LITDTEEDEPEEQEESDASSSDEEELDSRVIQQPRGEVRPDMQPRLASMSDEQKEDGTTCTWLPVRRKVGQ